MTIHKSQGMTLDRAELSLSDCFEYGQVLITIPSLFIGVRWLNRVRVLV